ncbi:MAG: VCBS repeat-containing protein [bacterium]
MLENSFARKFRFAGVFFALALALLAWSPAARALINPKFTPVELVASTKTILRVEIGPELGKGDFYINMKSTLKGETPGRMILSPDPDDAEVLTNLLEATFTNQATPALVFLGDFAKAKVDGGDVGQQQSSALLFVGTRWFILQKDQGIRFIIKKDILDMLAIWAGSETYLDRAVSYILTDPTANISVEGEAAWGTGTSVAKLTGKIHGCQAVRLTGDKLPGILVLCEAGDRYYSYQADTKLFVDRTEAIGLISKSFQAVCGDFDGDGLLDLASWDGKTLQFHYMTAAGKFFTLKNSMSSKECTSLAVCAMGNGKMGVVAAGTGGPVLINMDKDGMSGGIVGFGSYDKEVYTGSGPCVISDFNNDGNADILQIFTNGMLIYRGEAPGKWMPAEVVSKKGFTAICSINCGDYDNDGLLDLLIVSADGWHLLANQGAGKFSEISAASGEPKYKATGKITGTITCDFNGDGREDIIYLSDELGMQAFYNRSFACFGIAEELDPKENQQLGDIIDRLYEGQQFGAAADFIGDGHQQVALITKKGELLVLTTVLDKGWRSGLTVTAPAGYAGPLNVTARDGKRNLGVRQITPGTPAYFGKRDKGPLQLTWQYPGGIEATKTVVVIKPTEVELPEK